LRNISNIYGSETPLHFSNNQWCVIAYSNFSKDIIWWSSVENLPLESDEVK
jgi:hypothetical protein